MLFSTFPEAFPDFSAKTSIFCFLRASRAFFDVPRGFPRLFRENLEKRAFSTFSPFFRNSPLTGFGRSGTAPDGPKRGETGISQFREKVPRAGGKSRKNARVNAFFSGNRVHARVLAPCRPKNARIARFFRAWRHFFTKSGNSRFLSPGASPGGEITSLGESRIARNWTIAKSVPGRIGEVKTRVSARWVSEISVSRGSGRDFNEKR